MNLKSIIKEIPNFPKEGVVFLDITPIMANPKAFENAVNQMANMIAEYKPDKLLAAESRGFFFGPAIALKLGIPFIPVRKKGKLPRKTLDASYMLEYGTDTVCVHEEDIQKGDKIVLLDDILATGGTAEAMCRLVETAGAEVLCCSFFIELGFLKGRDKLTNRKVEAVLTY